MGKITRVIIIIFELCLLFRQKQAEKEKNVDNSIGDVINCTGNAVRRNSSAAYFAKRASVRCKEEKALHEYAFEHPPEQ